MKNVFKVGIYLLWIRPTKTSGTASYIFNLLDAFLSNPPDDFEFVLFTSRNNAALFDKYLISRSFKRVICPIDSKSTILRFLWENIQFDRVARNYYLDLIFVPIHTKPLDSKKIPYVVTIHDLQAYHYPQYFNLCKRSLLKISWKNVVKSAKKIVAISQYVKDDIINKLRAHDEQIEVIYNPVIVRNSNCDFHMLSSKWNIQKGTYLYTVSSMAPHKNLKVLIELMKLITEESGFNKDLKLVISGVETRVKEFQTFKNRINELGIEDRIIFTGYISNEERDCLYKNAKAFLFPSLFEGFGMPPIEAMLSSTPVITTKCSAIPEVTKNLAIYVDNPENPREWLDKLKYLPKINYRKELFIEFSPAFVAKKYLTLFRKILSESCIHK